MDSYSNKPSRALAPGTALPHNYIIKQVIGEGGFGITYECIHEHTKEQVAIKEYFPANLACRLTENGTQKIVPLAGQEDLFHRERHHFLTEASILLEFQHLEHIVSIADIFEENGTIYLVMEYVDGITLKQYIQENEPLAFDELFELITPVMRDLIQIHKKGLLHRDISPDNLILGMDNQLHLIDFGSADFESDLSSDMRTIILKSGFAPPEQYISDGKLGPWTDVYALCATIYYALTGFAPTEAIRRLQNDSLPELADHAQIRSWQANVIVKGLHLQKEQRYQTMDALYQAFIIPPIEVSSQRASRESIVDDVTVLPSGTPYVPTEQTKQKRRSSTSQVKWYYIAGLVLLLCILVYLIINVNQLSSKIVADSSASTQAASTTAVTEEPTTQEVTTESNLCTMIDVTGHKLADAKRNLFALDPSIQVKLSYANDSSKEAGIVLEQSVAPNTNFTRGSLGTILLTVNKLEENTTEATTQATTQTSTRSSSANNEQSTEAPKSQKESSSGKDKPSKSDKPASNEDIDSLFFDD